MILFRWLSVVARADKKLHAIEFAVLLWLDNLVRREMCDCRLDGVEGDFELLREGGRAPSRLVLRVQRQKTREVVLV